MAEKYVRLVQDKNENSTTVVRCAVLVCFGDGQIDKLKRINQYDCF